MMGFTDEFYAGNTGRDMYLNVYSMIEGNVSGSKTTGSGYEESIPEVQGNHEIPFSR